MKIPQTKGSYRCYLPVHGPQQGKGYAEGGEVPEKGFSAAWPKFRRSENIDDSRDQTMAGRLVDRAKAMISTVIKDPFLPPGQRRLRDQAARHARDAIEFKDTYDSQQAKDAGIDDVGRKGK